MEEANKYEDLDRRIREAQACMKIVHLFIAEHKRGLLDEAIATTRRQWEEQGNLKETLDREIKELRRQEVDLQVAIQNDQVGQQLRELERSIEVLDQQKQNKETQAEKYNRYARQLGLPEYRARATFNKTMRQLDDLLRQAREHLSTLMHERDHFVRQAAELWQQCQSLDEELHSLRQRKSQIQREDIDIRTMLTNALQIPEEDLPFIGELLRVRASEQRWEGAIERLLRGFGRRMLVSEQHYARVSRYVDSTDLHKRLVYSRVPTHQTRHDARQSNGQMLYAKLEVKPNTPFSDWLTNELVSSYDYLCCENIEDFQRARRALTINGQIKHTPDRHEKDDRTPLDDRKHYILGWNNTEKIAAIATDLARLKEQYQQVDGDIRRIDVLMQQERERQDVIVQLHQFDDFASIDWQADTERLDDLTRRKQELEQSADQLARLREQLARIQAQIKAAQDERDKAHSMVARFEQKLAEYKHQRYVCEQVLQKEAQAEQQGLLLRIERDARNHAHLLKLDSIEEAQEKIRQTYSGRITNLQGQQNPLRDGLIRRMGEFRQTSVRIAQEVDASLAALPDYRRYYEQIRRDGLPGHRKRFKELLNDKIIITISVFKATLDQHREDIETNLARLNESLRSISYTPSTYIQLCYRASRDPEILEFHNALRACLPDVSQSQTPEANEASFRHIQALIERFEREDRWTNKVTDVRNWLTFWAEEVYCEDGARKNHYDDSSGLSGGQKAKLASTILTSAIAYQYGLDQDETGSRALRFVVIDEAFSRSDEMNARYAMELFKQLDLQVLVVTPLEKIHIIEPYITACHYVTNTEEGNDSKIYNLTIEEYHRQKHSWQQEVA